MAALVVLFPRLTADRWMPTAGRHRWWL